MASARRREQRQTRACGAGEYAVAPAEREERQSRSGSSDEIDELPAEDPLTRRLVQLASSQRGAVTYSQLLDVGLTRSAISRRVQSGLLHRVHRGVYIFGHRALAPLARERAALLACGAGAVISHFSAARMWQLVNGSDDDPIHVTVARRLVRSRDHIRVHHCSQLKAGEVRRIDGLPLTAPIRTILDLAAVGHPQLERVLSEAHARSLIGSRDLTQLHELGRGRRGAQGLRMLLELERSGYTRSKAERLLRSVVRQAQLPQPLTNLRLAGYEVDFFWPTQKLVVEVDGYAFHGHRSAFERDRRKDAALVAAGYRVIRITWLQLTNEPFAVAAILASALTAARDRG